MGHTPGPWKISERVGGTIVSEVEVDTNEIDTGHNHEEYYGGYCIAESIARKEDLELIASAPEMKDTLKKLTEIIARNLIAWDTSKDKREGLLPEIYLHNRHWYKKLTGKEYRFREAIKDFNIE